MVPVKKSFGSFYALAAGTLWGSMGVFVRHFQAIGLNALEIGWFRVLFGLLVVGLYLALGHRELLKIRFRDVPLFVGTGVGSLFLLNLTYYTSMRYVSLAVAGVLLCSTVPTLQPTTGSMPGIRAFTAAVFGGIGSIPGAMLGGILLGIIETFSKAYLSTQFSDAIVFSVLIIILLVKPAGLLGKQVQEKV